MPMKNWHSVRLANPDKFVRFITQRIKDGIQLTIGYTESGESQVQSVKFDKDVYSAGKAVKWARRHFKRKGKLHPARKN